MAQTIELTPMQEQPLVPMRTSDTQEQFNVKTQNWMGVWKDNVTIWNNNLPALNTGLNAAVAVVYALPDIQTIIPEIENIAAVAEVATDVADVAAIKDSVVSCVDNLPAINAAPGAAESAAQSAADAAAIAASLHLPALTVGDTGKTLIWDGDALQWGTSYAAPVGTIAMYPADLPEPDGWLRCNGGDLGTAYPELAAVLGTTTLPKFGRTVGDIHFIDSGSGSKMWWALAVNSISGDIWASTYGGASSFSVYVQRGGTGEWIDMGAPNNSTSQNIAVDAISGDVWACGEKFVSVLRGGTGGWERIVSPTEAAYGISVVYFSNRDDYVVTYVAGTVLYWSYDKGATWSFKINMPVSAYVITRIEAYGTSGFLMSYSKGTFITTSSGFGTYSALLYGTYNAGNDTFYGFSDTDVLVSAFNTINRENNLLGPLPYTHPLVVNPYNFDIITQPIGETTGTFTFLYISNNKMQTVYTICNGSTFADQACVFLKENEIVFGGGGINHTIRRVKFDLYQEIIKAV